MDFTLRYKGPLDANAGPRHKHAIRRTFHPQLLNLWKEHPLLADAFRIELLGVLPGTREDESGEPMPDFVRMTKVEWIARDHPQGAFFFVPLVTKELDLVCSLDIKFFRREPPGQLIHQGGDIGNRIKTLFDALTMPDKNQVEQLAPEHGEGPFFCLLENDSLVTGFCVETERLLEPLVSGEERNVALAIAVRVSTTLASETEAFNRLKPAPQT
jgi:hypothetical protein